MSLETLPPYPTSSLYERSICDCETRLALIRNGSWQDPICCSFEFVDIEGENSAKQPYSALSYVWGSSKDTETIKIDGHDHRISINLACAIRHLRHERHLELIWIDAICINQDDIAERNSQVQMMRDIYAGAQRVIVFLGDGHYFRIPRNYAESPPPAPITFSTFDLDAPLINHFQTSWEKLCRRPEWYSFCTICVLRILENVDRYSDTIKCIADGKPRSKLRLFELVRQFVNGQWWQRVWVIQETTVSSEVVIQYGNVRVPWDILIRSASVCDNLGWGRDDSGSDHLLGIEREYAKTLSVFTIRVMEIQRLRRDWDYQQGSGLLSLLREFSGRKATDDRDKVFALLGLASDVTTIEPDYSLSTIQVYRHTVLEIIKHSGSLTALSGDMKRKNARGIPTWIPDWSVTIEDPDRRRMQFEELRNVSSRWRIEIVDNEHEYWQHVVKNMRKLHEEIETGRRKPLPKEVVEGLSRYQEILLDDAFESEILHMENLSQSEKDAIYLCQIMYKESRENGRRYWTTKAIKKFADAHASLPSIQSSGEWYRLEIINLCSKILIASDFQDSNDIHEATINEEQLQSLSDLIFLASEVLNLWTCSDILRAVEETKRTVKSLINLNIRKSTSDTDNDYTTLFSNAVVFVGSAAWMRCLRGLRDERLRTPYLLVVTIPQGQFIEMRRQKQRQFLGESENRLGLSSIPIATVGECTERLFTWVDSASRLYTISQWTCCAVRNISEGFALQFATTLVGDMYEESPGVFRQLRKSGETLMVWDWFKTSLLPKLCEVNPQVRRSQWVKLLDEKAESGLRTAKSFDAEMRLATEGRMFFMTTDNRMGLGPASMMPGDEIKILPGGNNPFVLRPVDKSQAKYEVIGDCFILTDEREHDPTTINSLQGSLPVEILCGLVPRWSAASDILLV